MTSNDVHDDAVSVNEDSLDKASVTGNDINNDDDVTNDSVITSDSATNDSVDVENKQNNDIVLNINEETCSSFLEPPSKKVSRYVVYGPANNYSFSRCILIEPDWSRPISQKMEEQIRCQQILQSCTKMEKKRVNYSENM